MTTPQTMYHLVAVAPSATLMISGSLVQVMRHAESCYNRLGAQNTVTRFDGTRVPFQAKRVKLPA